MAIPLLRSVPREVPVVTPEVQEKPERPLSGPYKAKITFKSDKPEIEYPIVLTFFKRDDEEMFIKKVGR